MLAPCKPVAERYFLVVVDFAVGVGFLLYYYYKQGTKIVKASFVF